MKKALELAIELGKKKYNLDDYNCKAFAKSFYQSIGGAHDRIEWFSDAKNNRIQKRMAKAFVLRSTVGELPISESGIQIDE